MSVRDRPRPNDSACLFGSQPRCFLDGLTAAEALIRGRQVFPLHQSRWWGGQPEYWLSRYPLRRSCAVPFKFFLAGRRPGSRRRGTVDLLRSTVARRVSSTPCTTGWDGPFGGIARYVSAHLRLEGQLVFRTTENVPRASTHGSLSVLPPSLCRWSGQLLRHRSCGVPVFQSCWLETLVSSLFQSGSNDVARLRLTFRYSCGGSVRNFAPKGTRLK